MEIQRRKNHGGGAKKEVLEDCKFDLFSRTVRIMHIPRCDLVNSFFFFLMK